MKILIKQTTLNGDGLYKKGQTYEISEEKAKHITPDYFEVISEEKKATSAPAAKKTTTRKK